MEKKPFLSIILPIYSGFRFFERCLGSLLSQKIKEEYEIILSVNLDAEEECKALAKKAASENDRFVYIEMKEANLAKMLCRLEGVKASKGEYITFIDNDDFYENDHAIEDMINEVRKNNADITIFPFFTHKKGKKKLGYAQNFGAKILEKNKAFNKLNADISMPHFLWNKIFKRSLFDRNLIIFDKKEDMFEDSAIVTSLFLNAETFYRSDIPYYCYVLDNPDAETKRARSDRTSCHRKVYSSERSYIEKNFPNYLRSWKKAFWRRFSFIIFDSALDIKNKISCFFCSRRKLKNYTKFSSK